MASLRNLAIAIVLLAVVCAPSARAEAARLALVIGNNNYQHLPKLQKAVGDAKSMKAALERLGFKVTFVEDAGFAALVTAVSAFEDQIAAGDLVALHYSGHGVSIDGRNYLIPVDMPQPDQETLVTHLATDAGDLVDEIRSRNPSLVFAILDACRDNPFASATRSIGSERGLSRMYAQAGEFVLFSAGPGESALDRLGDSDTSENSVFTRVLLQHLETPGQTLQDLAKATQGEVRRLAATVGHEQFPDYFDRTEDKPVLMEAGKPAPPPDNIMSDYQATAAIGTIEAWNLFLKAHADDADNLYFGLAKAAQDKLATMSLQTPEESPAGPVAEGSSEPAAATTEPADAQPSQVSADASSVSSETESQPATEAPQEEVVAMLPPAANADENAATPAPVAPVFDPAALARSLQTELKRVGCYSGSVDGDWGPKSRQSLGAFGRGASVEIPNGDPEADPNSFADILAKIEGHTERVCPAPPSSNASSTRNRPRSNRSGSSGNSAPTSRSCFEFNNQRYCE